MKILCALNLSLVSSGTLSSSLSCSETGLNLTVGVGKCLNSVVEEGADEVVRKGVGVGALWGTAAVTWKGVDVGSWEWAEKGAWEGTEGGFGEGVGRMPTAE